MLPSSISFMNDRQLPQETLARNVRTLMRANQMSERDLASKAKVAQKTVNNILNQTKSPTLETVDKIARVFGLNLWHLIMPDLPDELLKPNSSIAKLYTSYRDASPEGRNMIDRVAEREAQYTATKK